MERIESEVPRQLGVTLERARSAAAEMEEEPSESLVGLLRPVTVAAFHLGATAAQLRSALEEAMRHIFDGGSDAPS